LEWIKFEEREAEKTWMELMSVLQLPQIVDERAALDGILYADHISDLWDQWDNLAELPM
jgi:hypothetical protein